jgi:hypothetical protein
MKARKIIQASKFEIICFKGVLSPKDYFYCPFSFRKLVVQIQLVTSNFLGSSKKSKKMSTHNNCQKLLISICWTIFPGYLSRAVCVWWPQFASLPRKPQAKRSWCHDRQKISYLNPTRTHRATVYLFTFLTIFKGPQKHTGVWGVKIRAAVTSLDHNSTKVSSSSEPAVSSTFYTLFRACGAQLKYKTHATITSVSLVLQLRPCDEWVSGCFSFCWVIAEYEKRISNPELLLLHLRMRLEHFLQRFDISNGVHLLCIINADTEYKHTRDESAKIFDTCVCPYLGCYIPGSNHERSLLGWINK